MYKNVASQKVIVYAWDTLTDTAKTGDAANITAQISKDAGACAASNDTNPTELDATNAAGAYVFSLTQAESNCNLFALFPASSTNGVQIKPVIIYTQEQLTTIEGKIDTVDTNVDAIVAKLPDGPIGDATASKLFTVENKIDTVDTVADGIQTDLSNATDGLGAIKTLIDAIPTVAEIWAQAMKDLAAVPGITDSVLDAVNFMFELCRNKVITNGTNSELELYKDDGLTKLGEAPISDDGTNFTRDKWAAAD